MNATLAPTGTSPAPTRVRVTRQAHRLSAESDPNAFRAAIGYEIALQRERLSGALSLRALVLDVLIRRWPGTRTSVAPNQI